ncbi:hypothetical protein LOD99_6758 [Oopsacas minuta]|uniref:Uncharacterized protein n=1 Tax=Oopsacas minuta TaxID=111878 RepID=A0AAV7JKV2_9METZ|nr:hypothetical protein LOD99_6758 [Oopsacas minuta]
MRSELTTLSSQYKSQIVTTLISSVNIRFARYEQNEGFQMAAILDLRWKLDWCRPDEVTRYTNLLIEEVSLQYGPNEMDELETTSSPARKICKLFNIMVSQSSPISNSKEPSQTRWRYISLNQRSQRMLSH